MNILKNLLACLGRICMGSLFLIAGIHHFLDWNDSLHGLNEGLLRLATLTGPSSFTGNLVNKLLLWSPTLMTISLVCLFLGGFLVFFGIKTRFGAFLLALFILGSTLVFHAFWMLPADEKPLQMTMFIKNVAIFGGLLTLIAFGNGKNCGFSSKPQKED